MDAANIGAFLLKLRDQHGDDHRAIVEAVRLVTPFDDFILEPRTSGAREG